MTFPTVRRVSGLSVRRSADRHLSAQCPNTFLPIRHKSIPFSQDQYARANMKKCWAGLKSSDLITGGYRTIQAVTTTVRTSKESIPLSQLPVFPIGFIHEDSVLRRNSYCYGIE